MGSRVLGPSFRNDQDLPAERTSASEGAQCQPGFPSRAAKNRAAALRNRSRAAMASDCRDRGRASALSAENSASHGAADVPHTAAGPTAR